MNCHHCRHPQGNHGHIGCRECLCDVPFGTEDGYPPRSELPDPAAGTLNATETTADEARSEP